MTRSLALRTAYDLCPRSVNLNSCQKRQAIQWWQNEAPYTPLTCPFCQQKLVVPSSVIALTCPTTWCGHQTAEIPWAIYVAWQEQVNALDLACTDTRTTP